MYNDRVGRCAGLESPLQHCSHAAGSDCAAGGDEPNSFHDEVGTRAVVGR